MTETVTDLREILHDLLKNQVPPLKIRTDTESNFEVAGTKPTRQGKQKVDGFYFASVVPKPKDVRLYFFPIYTHATEFTLSDSLKKYLKGKSCFHLKALSDDTLKEIEAMIAKGIEIYQREGLI